MSKMLKLVWNKQNTPQELHSLLETLGEEFPVSTDGEGVKIEFCPMPEANASSCVKKLKDKILVEYTTPSSAARGIGNALAGLTVSNTTGFSTLGIMLDVSRNMVMTPQALKRWFRRLALAGYNTVMLYTEDTYQLEDEPVFGYMRGGYTLSEIQELDAYAQNLGIELIGCIQTLGHLEQILQWSQYSPVRDTASVLLADQPETEALIEKMLQFWDKALKSRRIHIGMDETHDLGRGVFLDRFGYERGFDIFNRHLNKVNSLCRKYGLQPQIWSDMYFRLANPQQEYYNTSCPIPPEVQAAIPRNVQLVYWDYYHAEEEFYSRMLRRHKEMGFEPIMASSVWTWPTLWYDHKKTAETVRPCITACQKENIRELIFTMWGDDGAFCHIDSALAGLFHAADQAWQEMDNSLTEKRFDALCAPTSFAAHLAASRFNTMCQRPDGTLMKVFSSYLIWDDPLQSIALEGYLRNDPAFSLKLIKELREIQKELCPHLEKNGAGDLKHAYCIMEVLIQKLELQNALKAAYAEKDRAALEKIAGEQIPQTAAAVTAFDNSFRKQWMRYARPFGLERIQGRNGALLLRLQETALRIKEFLNGDIEKIDELECCLPQHIPANEHYGRYALVSGGTCII